METIELTIDTLSINKNYIFSIDTYFLCFPGGPKFAIAFADDAISWSND